MSDSNEPDAENRDVADALDRFAAPPRDRLGAAPSETELWALAAGELAPDAATRVADSIQADPNSLAALALAELALQEDAPTARAVREATAQKALAGAVSLRAPRIRPSPLRTILPLVAAAALIVTAMWWWNGSNAFATPAWRTQVVSSSQSRGDARIQPVAIQFRIEVTVPTAMHIALVSVSHDGQDRVRATVQLPALPAIQHEPEYAGWSTGQLEAGQHTIPPAGVGPYALQTRGVAVIFLLAAPSSFALDHATAEQWRDEIERECRGGLAPEVLDKITTSLSAGSVRVYWRQLWPQ